MLKGSKQPWTAASGLLLCATDDSYNYKHDHANMVFKRLLRTKIQPVKEMQIRKMLHASFLVHAYCVRHELIKGGITKGKTNTKREGS